MNYTCFVPQPLIIGFIVAMSFIPLQKGCSLHSRTVLGSIIFGKYYCLDFISLVAVTSMIHNCSTRPQAVQFVQYLY